jgi:hypothetical protein
MTINIGDWVYTPRMCKVQIEAIFASAKLANEAGYGVSTDYKSTSYGVLGRMTSVNHYTFAAYIRS